MFDFLKRKEPVKTNSDFVRDDTHTRFVEKTPQKAPESLTEPIKRSRTLKKDNTLNLKMVRSLYAHKNPQTGKRHTVAEISDRTGIYQRQVYRLLGDKLRGKKNAN